MRKYMISGFSDEISPDFNRQIEVLNSFGVSFMEIRGVDGKNISECTIDEVKSIKEKLDKNHISVSAVGSPIGKVSIESDFDEHFTLFKHICEIAKILETKYIRMFSFYTSSKKEDESEVIKRLSILIDYAKNHDLILLHENEKGIYGDTADCCLNLMKKLYCENFKAIFDFANFIECKEDTLNAYKMLKPYIEYIHVKDSDENKIVPIGMGKSNANEILRDLLFNNYSGFFSMEPHLTDFSGLSNLEKGEKKSRILDDSEFAWHIALNSLKAVLYDLEG